MKEIIYSPVAFNRPPGAISDIEAKEIRILVRKDLNKDKISLLIYSDINDLNISKYEMNFVEDILDYSIFSVKLEKLGIGIYYYFFEIVSDCDMKIVSKVNGEAQVTDHMIPWQLTVYDKDYKTPDWIKGGIIYQIFPDRFKKSEKYKPVDALNEEERFRHEDWYDIPKSNIDTPDYSARDFFMGNLDGIIERREYLEFLNIDLLYLNPVFESAENHRYSTADYFKIDPYLGNNEVFENMCDTFKESNIEVMLDGVFSHTGSDSIYFNKYSRYDEIGAYNSMKSRYYPWFKFTEYPDEYESWWGFDNLPTLNKDNKDYIDFICEDENGVLNFWQKKGIKAWRFDVIDELPDIFIDSMRKSIKKSDKDTLMIGEVWEDASNKVAYGLRRRYLLGKQVDSVMNYPWRNAIIDFVKNKDAIGFSKSILEIINNYPTPSIDTMMNLLSSHDTERITTVLGTDISSVDNAKHKDFRLSDKQYEEAKKMHKFASFIQFTLPGVPSIYYGDEIAMQGFRDPFNRAGYDYKSGDKELLIYYKSLVSFRKKYRKNFISNFKLIDGNKRFVAYRRNNILCIINFSSKAMIVDYPFSGEWVFGNKKPFFTDYGIVVGSESYTGIEIDSDQDLEEDIEVFKKAINLRD